ncbi:c-type cytochrome [Roseovarius phycicola]|uniref:C-type cytochrome n=1 Tax=Roseovarius phycicola TaxID=3080976 RepID=A0ABZ2HJG7_9RHOB
MKSYVTATAALFCLAAPALADGHASGDPAAGEKAFKQCKSCHMVADGDNVIVKGGKTGPNLYGVVGRTAGTADFKYSKDVTAAGEGGLAWDEASFVAFVQNPNDYLKEATGNDKARSKMTFKARKEEDAVNIWAYLASVGPES